MNMVNMSIEMKKPYTPMLRSVNQRKYSLFIAPIHDRHAVGEDGTVYVGGYYGPDPVAISASGELLWEADSGRDTFWLYDMEITDEGVVCTYDAIDGAPGPAEICYGFDGSVAWVRVSGE